MNEIQTLSSMLIKWSLVTVVVADGAPHDDGWHMSKDISIAVSATQTDAPALFQAVLARLRVHKVFWAMFGDKVTTASYLDPATVLTDFPTLLTDITHSHNHLRLACYVPLRSGAMIEVHLMFFGQHYRRGWAVREDGHILMLLEFSDLIPLSIARQYAVPLLQPGTGDGVLPHLSDAECLFLDMCGLLDRQELGPRVEHGALYVDSGWPSPDLCSMLYHADVADFAKDVGRIYAARTWEFYPALLYLGQVDVWNVSATEHATMSACPWPSSYGPDMYLKLEHPASRPDLHWQFLSILDRSLAERLSALSGEQVRQILRGVYPATQTVQSYDFGPAGMVLVADPLFRPSSSGVSLAETVDAYLSVLWRAYEYIVVRGASV